MAEQPFAQDFRSTGDRNGVPPGWKRVEISVAPPPPGNCRSPKIDNKFDNGAESACLIIEWDKIPGYPVDIGESSASCRRFALFRAVNSTDATTPPFINDPRSSSLLNSRITRRSIARQRGKIGSSLSRFLPLPRYRSSYTRLLFRFYISLCVCWQISSSIGTNIGIR